MVRNSRRKKRMAANRSRLGLRQDVENNTLSIDGSQRE
jgi:hypothetical protein